MRDKGEQTCTREVNMKAYQRDVGINQGGQQP